MAMRLVFSGTNASVSRGVKINSQLKVIKILVENILEDPWFQYPCLFFFFTTCFEATSIPQEVRRTGKQRATSQKKNS